MVSNIKLAGNFRASIIRERMSEGYIESSYFKATHTARGVRDSIAVVSSLNADTEVYCVFYRLLDQSHATTHKHINSIYRKFNVNSRSALMAIWLGERN